MSRPNTPTYKTLNWPSYNEALKRRGSLMIWFDPGMAWTAKRTGKRGRQPVYSDAAVQNCLTMKVLFGMALRQTTGFVESFLSLIGLDWDVPDFSTLSRRQKALVVNIPHRGSQGPLHLLIDRTGIKVEGEGEWNARKHGGAKSRVWRKVHLGIDQEALEVRAVEVTSSDIGDAPMLPAHFHTVESVFATVRHRTVRTKGALSQKSVKLMVFTLVRAASKTWRRLNGANQLPRVIEGALLRNSRLRHDGPFPRQHQATRTISAVPRAEKRFISAMRIWISAVWRSGSLAAMRSPKAFRHRIFASMRLRTWYPVQRFQNARP